MLVYQRVWHLGSQASGMLPSSKAQHPGVEEYCDIGGMYLYHMLIPYWFCVIDVHHYTMDTCIIKRV